MKTLFDRRTLRVRLLAAALFTSGVLLQAGYGFAFENKFDYVDAWNFTIQRQLASDLALEIAYVGNIGRRLFWNENPNLPIPGPGPANPRRPYFARFGLIIAYREVLREIKSTNRS